MRLIVAGGGTGGHLFPGIAVAREIQRRHRDADILFVGAEQGIEARLVPKEGFALRTLPAGSFKGIGWLGRVRNLFTTMSGVLKARRILREFRPDVVIGVGGYASFPLLCAATLGGYPRLIMEQNAIPGLANRILGRFANYAAVTDARTKSFFGPHAVVTGNPIRPQFKTIAAREHRPPFRILIFGGSQGARSINKAAIDSLRHLSDLKAQIVLVHQTGQKSLEEIREGYAHAGFHADVRVFFDDFHEQYAAADLIVSRSGATTVAEIKAAGRAAILIPFPYAADDHQARNAESMVEEDAAVMIPDREASGERLASAIRSLLSDTNRLRELEANARRIAVLDAESRIADLAEQAMSKHNFKEDRTMAGHKNSV